MAISPRLPHSKRNQAQPPKLSTSICQYYSTLVARQINIVGSFAKPITMNQSLIHKKQSGSRSACFMKATLAKYDCKRPATNILVAYVLFVLHRRLTLITYAPAQRKNTNKQTNNHMTQMVSLLLSTKPVITILSTRHQTNKNCKIITHEL